MKNTYIILGIIMLITAIVLSFSTPKIEPQNPPDTSNDPIACTMDAKICPDGSAVGRTGPRCEFAACPNTPPIANTMSEFNKPITLAINEHVAFYDGLTFTVKEINDSRCKPEVQCIWAGEISTLILASNGKLSTNPQEIRLGTTNTKSVNLQGYTFTLISATEKTITVTVE